MTTPDVQSQFESLLAYVKDSRCFDFTGYKRSSLERRVRRRMQDFGVHTFEEYQDYLEVHPTEFVSLFNTILVNVTGFFRDTDAWDYLRDNVLPGLIGSKAPDAPIRVWSAGCASGEEAYSVAMLLCEALGPERFRQSVKIYATDVDEEALAQARQATYSASQTAAVPQDLRDKYFEQVGNSYVFRQDLRRAIIFGRHDLVQDAPISRLDLLICRNTLIYLNAETQAFILSRFSFALNPRGILFLGRSETILSYANLFLPLSARHRVFQKAPGHSAREPRQLIARGVSGDGADSLPQDRQRFLREAAFQKAPVPQIVVDPAGNLLLANDQARAVFDLNPLDLGRPFQDLELSYRPVELRSLIDQAYILRRSVSLLNIHRFNPNGDTQHFDVEVGLLTDEEDNPLGVNVTFKDVTAYNKVREDLENSRQELETAYEELQSTNEELETTNEELQSTVEELETTNEELQSTNEELETMNDELQAANQEMENSNMEMQLRTQETDEGNAFLQSILSSLPDGLVVVDTNLMVLIWNRRAEDLWGLRQDEVKGRSLLNLDVGLPLGDVQPAIFSCLRDGEQKVVTVDALTRRGKKTKCRVTCTPQWGSERKLHGAIVLMEELSD